MPTMIEDYKNAVHYQLDLQLPAKQDGLVTEAVCRLPCAVQEFVLEYIQFMLGNSSAFSKKDIRKKYVVILGQNAHVFTVLHEIAHCWLGHCKNLSQELETSEKAEREKEANRQARKWMIEKAKEGD
jgi:Zn-dependent peptidase ImmA (M78 family)